MKTFSFLLALTCISFITRAQDGTTKYVYNTLDKTTFATSCGENNNDGWVVSKNSCNFYTPLTSASDDSSSKWITINSIFSSTQNLDARDFVWIFYYINGNTAKTSTIKGEPGKTSYEFSDSILVPAGGSYRFRIAMVCDESDEYWKLENGNLIITTGKNESDDIQPVQQSSLITVSKDRGTAKLKWMAPPGEAGNYFKIERSANGEKYEFAGFVKENLPAAGITSYSFIDAGAITPQSWYRIRKVNDAGKESEFGEVVSIKL